MQKPLVSILLPFKNTDAFLAECISSILEQNHSTWEVIAVDDHSTDNSYDIIQQFELKDSRIKLLKNKGVGIIPALRTAYEGCKGEMITRMDSDDIMAPNKISSLVSALLHHGHNHIAIGKVNYFSNGKIGNGYKRYEQWLNLLTERGINFSEIYKECVIPSPCWMTYKEDLDNCGAFDSDMYPEDYDLAFRFYQNRLKCIPCNAILHHWRDYDTRTSRTSEHYAQNYFLEIKLHYFLKLDYHKDKNLVVWGAGFKGKSIAKELIERKIEFYWICDNPKKIGKNIYGITLNHFSILDDIINTQSIITVANEDAQVTIKSYFSKLNQNPMKDYFLFC